MTMLIPFAGLSPVPWKNGGGSTTQMAVFPPDAGFDDFDWPVSLATMLEDGEFWESPGVERTLALVDGHGTTVDVDGEARLLTKADPVGSFDGESRVVSKLNGGASTDLNIMTPTEPCCNQFG